MRPEIAARVAQVRRGEIPDGYRRTKLGIAPMEWRDVSFADLFISASDCTDDLETYPLYSLTLENGITAKTERYNRSHLVKKTDSYKIVRPNDFAYNPMNIRFGAVARHKGAFPVAVSGYYDIFTTVFPDDLAFMDSFLTCGPMIAYYNKVSTGSILEKQRVHFSQFLEFSLPLPPLAERKKIGEVLAAQDKIIALKERLIAEKTRQKRYLMQQYLTGKRRLPGFHGEWEIIRLKSCSEKSLRKNTDFSVNLVFSNSAQHGIIPQLEQFDKSIANKESIDGYFIVNPGDFVYNPRISVTAPCGPINVNETGKTGIASPLYTVFTVNPLAIHREYLKHYFKSSCWFRYIKSVANYGARHDRMNILDGDFFAMPIPYPPIEEQTAIADILSVADREIELLRRELDLQRRQKKSLAQLLLTGLVRLS